MLEPFTMPARSTEPVEGELQGTPFAHILVYAADRRLTGALFLEEPSGVKHVVRFAEGAPVKVRPGDGYARLGEMLIEAGVITEEALRGALSMQGLLGDALILSGSADHDAVERVAAEQFMRRMVRLFELPPETRYTYIDGDPELAEWGGDPASVDPLLLLWAGLRDHAHCSTLMERTLRRLGDAPVRVHPAAPLGRFGFTAGELAAIVRIKGEERSLSDLTAARVAPPDTLRRLIYALLITRNLDFGKDVAPVSVAAAPSVLPVKAPSSAPASEPSEAPPPTQPIARMQLRTVTQRVGAAAPDAPGDGEPRAALSPRPKK